MVGDLVFERPFPPEVLRAALADLCGVVASRVEVVSTLDDAHAESTVSAVVQTVEGDFRWLVSVMCDPSRLPPMIEVAKALSTAMGARLLVGDDTVPDPNAVLLVSPGIQPASALLDADSLERGEFSLALPPCAP
jgi:hypothetical protein